MTNRQIIIICILLLLPALYYGVSTYPVQTRIKKSYSTNTTVKVEQSKGVDNSGVRFDYLEKRSTGGTKMKNNIFGSLFPIVKPKVKKKPVPRVVKTPPKPKPKPIDVDIVRQELAQFTFLGLVKKKGLYKVFLSRGEEIFVVGAEDKFGPDQNFVVNTLSATELVVRQGDDPRAITIPLVERQTLQATYE